MGGPGREARGARRQAEGENVCKSLHDGRELVRHVCKLGIGDFNNFSRLRSLGSVPSYLAPVRGFG